MGSKLNDVSDIIQAARSVREQGVDVVLVSMGARGILLVAGRSALSKGGLSETRAASQG